MNHRSEDLGAVRACSPTASKDDLVREAMSRASSLDFRRLKMKINVESGVICPECNLATEYIERRYRQFLALQAAYPSVKIVPTKSIDAFWHAHILDTKAYEEDCKHVFGHFLHHYPYFGLSGAEDKNNLQSSFQKTCELWQIHFGSRPDRDPILPTSSNCSSGCSNCSSCSVL